MTDWRRTTSYKSCTSGISIGRNQNLGVSELPVKNEQPICVKDFGRSREVV